MHARSVRGSAYGIAVAIEDPDLQEFHGEVRTFTRTGETGNPVEYDFCPVCATTVRWRVPALPGRQVFAGGAFDTPSAFEMVGEMYAGKALPWARIDCEIVRSGAPDQAYRAAVIARTASKRED